MRIAAMMRPVKPPTEPAMAAVWVSALDADGGRVFVDADGALAPWVADVGVDGGVDACDVWVENVEIAVEVTTEFVGCIARPSLVGVTTS